MKVEAIDYGDRRVYSVAAFNGGVAQWLARLPTVWVEGEITELRRQDAWQSVFFTLKDPADGACLAASMLRGRFDGLRLDLRDGERVHVLGRPELYEAKGDFRLRVLSIERFGIGRHLASLERLRQTLAAEGLFAAEAKRPLPLLPRRIGLVTGSDAAAKQDVLTTIVGRFPAARVLVAETLVQGPRAAESIVDALGRVATEPEVDVIVLARGGGSFEDLLPFSDERVVRAVAAARVPIVSAVGHEQDTPLCDLAADVRASTPTMAAKLVVPDALELAARLERQRVTLARCARSSVERGAERVAAQHGRLGRAPGAAIARARQGLDLRRERLARAPASALERKRTALGLAEARLRTLSPRSTLERGYAIVREGRRVVRASAELAIGASVDVQLAEGAFTARVEETEI